MTSKSKSNGRTKSDEEKFALKPDPQNANVGTKRGRQYIENSLGTFGAGRSIVTAKDGTILAGNKTFEAAQMLGLKTRVIETQGDELVVVRRTDLEYGTPEATGIAIADNRASEIDLTWDNNLIKDLSLVMPEIEPFLPPVFEKEYRLPPKALGGEESVLEAKMPDDVTFQTDNPYGIPPLLPEMIAEIPEGIQTACHPLPVDVKNFCAVYSFTPIPDEKKPDSILCFYTVDTAFQGAFEDLSYYGQKWLAEGWGAIVTPNFSCFDTDPLAVVLYWIYRSRHAGRYLQELGIKIIPDLDLQGMKNIDNILYGIPEGKAISVQMQTHFENATTEQKIDLEKCLYEVKERINPPQVLCYGAGGQAADLMLTVFGKKKVYLCNSFLKQRGIARARKAQVAMED